MFSYFFFAQKVSTKQCFKYIDWHYHWNSSKVTTPLHNFFLLIHSVVSCQIGTIFLIFSFFTFLSSRDFFFTNKCNLTIYSDSERAHLILCAINLCYWIVKNRSLNHWKMVQLFKLVRCAEMPLKIKFKADSLWYKKWHWI